MRHLSAVLLILLLVALPSCKYFKGGKGKKAKIEAMMKAREDSTRVADSLRKVQDELMAVENAKLEAERKAEEERLAMEARLKYNIIVGSFITPEYARGLAEVYRQKGYDPKIIKMEGSRFELVSAEGHNNFSKAVSRLKEFQDNIELDAWMYIVK